MSRKLVGIWILVLVFFWGAGCQESKPQLTIAVAANLQFVMPQIIDDFQKETGQSVDVITGSSGKLYAQIVNGAPYDVFLSADTLFPSLLVAKGIGRPNWEVFAYGTLVLWSSDPFNESVDTLLWNYADTFTKIQRKWAMANPEIAPYGLASQQFLNNKGLFESMQLSMIKGESISQVNQFVYSKSVLFGFTSYSSVLAKKVDANLWKVIPRSEYAPIQQTSIMLKDSDNAKAFMEFLMGEKASNRLKSFGYVLPNS